MRQNRHPLSAAREIRLSFSLATTICLLLGLLMVFAPNTSRKLLSTLVGVGMLIYGLLNIGPHLMSKGEEQYTLDLLIGVSTLAFGLFSLFNPIFLMDFLFTVMGLIICITSVSGLRRALNLRSFGFVRWWAPLSVSIATLLLALCVIFFPGLFGNMLMVFMGMIFVAEALNALFSIHCLSSYANRITVVHSIRDK